MVSHWHISTQYYCQECKLSPVPNTISHSLGRTVRLLLPSCAGVLNRVNQVKWAYEAMDPDVCTIPVDITVSYDGSWHKRGYTSMYKVAVVNDVYTGLVVDYVVLSKFCLACTCKKTELGTGSQRVPGLALKPQAACRLWRLQRRALHWFLRDGDSKAYNAVVKLYVYDMPIVKEECINDVHKRMGTALRNLTKQKKLGQGDLEISHRIKLWNSNIIMAGCSQDPGKSYVNLSNVYQAYGQMNYQINPHWWTIINCFFCPSFYGDHSTNKPVINWQQYVLTTENLQHFWQSKNLCKLK